SELQASECTGAHRIEGHARTVQIQKVGDPVRHAGCPADEAYAIASRARLCCKQRVFAEHHAGVDTDLPGQIIVRWSLQVLSAIPRVLQRAIGVLEEQPL